MDTIKCGRAAKELTNLFRIYDWFVSVGVSEDEKLFLNVSYTPDRTIPTRFCGLPVVTKEISETMIDIDKLIEREEMNENNVGFDSITRNSSAISRN